MKKLFFIFLISLLFLDCQNPSLDGDGAIVINLNTIRSVIPWPSDDSSILNYIDYIISITGNDIKLPQFEAKGKDTIKVTVPAGQYTVKIDAYLEGYESDLTPNRERIHYATGSSDVNVKASQTTAVIVTMYPASSGGVWQVSTLAGSGASGFLDGLAANAQFNQPTGVAVDSGGNVYVADFQNHRIRKIDSNGNVTTLAGSGTAGFVDGTGTAAQFNNPSGLIVDAAGNVYVADNRNHCIRKIDNSGNVTTLAGSGTEGFADGTGTAAQFYRPYTMALDSAGNVYVVETGNNLIRKINPVGDVTTLAGSGTAGFADGTGTAAQFNSPSGIAVDSIGNVYVADFSNHRIRKINSSGNVTTLAGSGTAGFADGTGTTAQFNDPLGIAVDSAGNVYVSERSGNRIRMISPAGVVTTIAGNGISGFADGTGDVAQFYWPMGIAFGSNGNIYVADTMNSRIRKLKR